MIRRKNKTKDRSIGKRSSPGLWFWILLIVGVVLLLFLMVPGTSLLALGLWESLLKLMGAGLVLVALALTAILWTIFRRPRLLIRYWNLWLGSFALALAFWGFLTLFTPSEGILSQVTLGGEFGKKILGSSFILGGLRLAGLVLLGVFLVAPRSTWQFWQNVFKGLGSIILSLWRAIPRPTSKPSSPLKHYPEVLEEKPKVLEERASLTPSSVSQPELISPEVGKRYERQPIITPGGWQLPPLDILELGTEIELSQADNEKRAKLIEEALASYGVEAKVVQINAGPTVTQFGVEPGWIRKYKKMKERDKDGNIKLRLEEFSRTRVKVERITSLANDLALALAVPTLRIEVPVPGKSMVGIEVPNISLGLVTLRSVIETTAYQRLKTKSKLALALGKGSGGEAVVADLVKMPHLLIAGATGSGKTVCLNSIICCLLAHNTPDDLRFVMVDPKRVELVAFNGIPHLLAPVVVDTDKAVRALHWLNHEMDSRYRKLAQAGARNIESYNKFRPPDEILPYLVLIIDELADLMMMAFDEVERTLCRLAQLSRATGIHLIVATQRPSVDVVTGLIKANFPTRISFAVTSQVDSRTILDTGGAEKLLGRGDMLYMPTDAARPKRLQGCFTSDTEIERLVYFWRQQRPQAITLYDFEEFVCAPERDAEDPLLEAARRLAQEHGHISTSFLQRRLHIGYPRAARLLEILKSEESRGREEESGNVTFG